MGSYSSSDFLLELEGYRLTTVEILYRLPDYPDLLQTFIWQNLDLPPDFPRLKTFLSFWEHNIEGRLFRVTVAQADDVGRAETQLARAEFILH